MNNSMSNSKNNIELSVIIPFYNSIKTAKDSLESVQSELEKEIGRASCRERV